MATTLSYPTPPLYPTPQTSSSLAWDKLHAHSGGACTPPPFWQESTPPRLTGLRPARYFSIVSGPLLDNKALCRQLRVIQHHHSILHHGHHPPWLGIGSTLTPEVPAHPLRSGRKALHQG